MALDTLCIPVTGVSPLVMHNNRLANPLDPISKKIKEHTSKKKKTDETLVAIAELEFAGGLWLDKDGHPCIPGRAVEATILNSAKLQKRGKEAKCAIFVEEDAPLKYEGPKTAEGLWEKRENFALTVGARVQNGIVQRTRPIFRKWSATLKVKFDTEIFNRESLVKLLEDGGRLIGFGDWRPRYGRFEVGEESEE